MTALMTAFAAQAAQFKFPNQTLTVPDGFEVELVAGRPLVDRPVSVSFDEQGRLFVTDSSGSNDKPDKQLEQKPHRVVLLEDTRGDGRFDKTTVFADHMMFPEGCLWHKGSLYVSAPPSIWKLTDTNHDGIADVRVEWHQGKTLTGCANDLHGPYLGPDGWIYWCKGAFAEQSYDRPGRIPFVSKAAHIFRARPDGTGIEAVMTGGMDMRNIFCPPSAGATGRAYSRGLWRRVWQTKRCHRQTPKNRRAYAGDDSHGRGSTLQRDSLRIHDFGIGLQR